MANNSEDIKWLYGKLKAKGYDIGSEQDFSASLANKEDRDWYYSKATGMGLDMGSKDDFEALYAPSAAPATAAPHTQAAAGSVTAQQPPQQPAAQKQEAAQPAWRPSAQDKIRMQYEMLHGKNEAVPDGKFENGDPKYKFTYRPGLHDFNARSRARVEQARRVAERNTPEGRERQKSGQFLAQTSGTPTRLFGLATGATPGLKPLYREEEDKGMLQQIINTRMKPVMSGQGPVAYGVVEVDGKRKTQWLLPDGSLTTNLADADAAEYGARRVRLMNRFVGRMKSNGLDPANQEDVQQQAQLDMISSITSPLRREGVAESLWKEAEEQHKADKDRNASKHWGDYAAMGGGREMRVVTTAMNRHDDLVSHMTRFDLQSMMDKAWSRVGDQLTENCYNQLRRNNPETPEAELRTAASEWARQLSDLEIYNYAVEQNTPKSTLEFFGRKVADANLINSVTKGLARMSAGTPGDLAAYQQAMEEYGKDHKGASIGGTVVGMAIDPTTWISGGMGSLAGKGAVNLGGRFLASRAAGMSAQVGERLFSSSLTGRILTGMAAGAANLGTFEAMKEGEQQFMYGGYVNPETGEVEGYSLGAVLNSGVHGVGMGAATGVVSPLIGNVADKAVKATTSTAGKVAMRGAEVLTSTLAEGTIFSIQEWVEGDRDAFDVWTDNMAMMAGFKLSHGIKTAPDMIRSLRPVKPTGDRPLTRQERIHNNKSFAERLRERMDQSPADIAMTAEEREELKRRGYGELSDLFAFDPEHKSRKVNAAQKAEGDYTGITGLSRAVDYEARPEETGNPTFDGYEAMERLMEDGSVSEATRAKAYYILTGRNLPMSTVTDWSITDNGDGTTTVTSSSNEGSIVTSRTFSQNKDVEREVGRIKRQAELNTIDIGEQYRNAEAQGRVMEAAIEDAAPGADPQTVYDIYEKWKRGDKSLPKEYQELAERVDEAIERNTDAGAEVSPAGIRERISQETGVDVDKAIRKEPGKRTESEQEAVKRYARELFPEPEAYEPTPEEAEADRVYEESRLLFGRFEQGDPEAQAEIDAISLRMTEAHQLCEDAFGDEAEVYMAEIRENPWGILNDPNLTPDQKDAVLYYINARASLDGVLDASNEAAADKRQKVESEVARRTHKERGVVVPATMKADDQPVYIINGEAAMFPDGSGVDVRNSSDSVIILDETGEYKFTSPDQILSVGEAIDPQIELQTAYDAIDREQEAIISAATEGMEPAASASAQYERETGDAVEKHPEDTDSAANVEEYDRGYEEGTQIASTLDDNTLNTAIEDLRGRDWLSDEWRGRLEAYEYEQQARALAAQSAPDPNVGLDGPQTAGEVHLEQMNNGGGNAEENTPDNAPEGQEGETAPSALARIPVDDKTGDPHLTHESVDAETAWDAAVEFFGGDEDALGYVQSQINTSKAEIGKAEKEISKVKPTGGMTKYRDDLAKARAKVEAAKQEHERWKAIEAAQQRKKTLEATRRLNEQRERDAQLHDEAVARFEEEQRIKAEKKAEQEARGAYTPHPDIKKKWDESPKYYGPETFITLANGKIVNGRYVYHEAYAATPSHDPFNGFQISEGSPLTPEGLSVNPRQYDADSDARHHTENISMNYDARGIREDKVVQDGNMLSGNGGASARQLAAQQGTDAAFIEALRAKAKEEGISEADFNSLEHPDRSFEPDEKFAYTPETYDIFNADGKKSMSRDEQSVRHGMTVSDNTFMRISDEIGRFDTLDDFYRTPTATNAVLRILNEDGTVPDNEMSRYKNGDELSGTGEDLIENILMGKVFDGNPNAIRQLSGFKQMRRSVLNAMNEITTNRRLERSGFGLDAELARAIDLATRAKNSSDIYGYGMPVSPFGRMQGLFDDEQGDSMVTDGTVLLLADLLNSRKPNDLRNALALYNKELNDGAIGQTYFTDEGELMPPKTKKEVLTFVNQLLKDADPREKQRMVEEAFAARKNEAEQRADGGSPAAEQAPDSGERGADRQERAGGNAGVDGEGTGGVSEEEITAPLSKNEKDEYGKPLVKASDGTTVFGEIESDSGLTAAPIRMSLGENHKDAEGRNHGYGLLHIEAGHGAQIRNAGFESVEEFVEDVARNYTTIKEGAKVGDRQTYLLEVSDKHNNTLYVQLSSDGSYWNVNSAGIFKKRYSRNKPEVHSRPALGSGKDTDTTEVISGHTEGATAPAGNSPMPSDDKGNALPTDKQAEEAESSEEPTEEKPVVGLEGYSRREIKDIVGREVEQILSDADIDAEIVGMEIHGSRNRGDARPDSDLDIVLEYKGDMKEYAMFNAINETPIEIDGVQVDVNPIRTEETGTLSDYMKKSRSYDEEKLREAEASVPSLGDRIAQAEATVNTEPTEAQKEAGNYRKGHVNVEGFDVTIEQPKGSVRRGKDANGNPWESKMNNTYGYIRGTEGVDGDHIDVFLSDTPEEGNVYVVDQYEPDGTFDEHKVMYGFPDAEAARSAYLSNYEKGWDKTRRIDVTGVTKEDFKKWIQSSRRKTKPFADYKSVKALTEEVDQKRTNINKEGIITDGDGQPLTLYHGTPNKEVTSVSMLEPGHKRIGEDAPARFNGDGVSFTPEMSVAQDYASESGHGKGRIFPANIRLQNPYYTLGVANFTPEEAAEFTESLKAKGHDGIINYASASMREIGAAPNEVIVFDNSAILPIKENSLEEGWDYTITPTTYTNKKGKTSDVWLVKFDRDLSKEEKAALDTYTREPLAEGRKTSRGWYDRKEGGYMMRSEEAAKGLAGIIGNDEAVADAQPLSAEDYKETLSKPEPSPEPPKEPTPMNRVDVEGLFNDLRTKGETRLSDHAEPAASERPLLTDDEIVERLTTHPMFQNLVDNNPDTDAAHDMMDKIMNNVRVALRKSGNTEDYRRLTQDRELQKRLQELAFAKRSIQAPAPEPKRMVVDDEMRDMEDELRSLLGIDDSEGDRGDLFKNPEDFTNKERMQITSLGITYALKYFDQGIVSFPDFADRMVRRMGEKIRPWLKAFYGGARDIPGYDHLPFTPADEVKAFDVMNFDKAEKEAASDPLRTAQAIVAEHRAEAAVAEGKREIKEQRNQKRKERDEQTTADTVALAKEAGAIAREAEATAESATDGRAIAEAEEKVDEALDRINEQLALLGYYEAEPVAKDFNEAYGYMRNAEKKALADAVKLARQLVNDLGIEIDKVTSTATAKKGKKPTAVRANIAPAGGDISIRLPLNEGRELAVSIYLDPTSAPGEPTYSGDNLQVSGIMYRVENPNGTGHDRYGRNQWAEKDCTYADLLHRTQRETYRYLPERSAQVGEYKSGDSIQYSADGGKTWTDGKVVEINGDGSLKLDTGLAPVLYVNATREQVRRKDSVAKAAPGKEEPKQETPAETPESATDKAIETLTGKKKPVRKTEVKPEQTVGDLFSGLFDEPINSNEQKKTDVRTRPGTGERAGGHEPRQDEPVGTSQRNEDGGTDGRGMAGRGGDNPLPDTSGSNSLSGISPEHAVKPSAGKDRKKTVSQKQERLPEAERKNARNNRAERGKDYAPKGVDARIKANIKAIELAQELLESGATATPEQMAIIRQFSGWGGLGKAFNDDGYSMQIKKLLGDAYQDAVDSRKSAYDTPAYIIDTMWDIARAMGFNGGNVLEGSAGIGNILGLMPEDMSDRSNIHAVEVDRTTGGMLSLLYPDAKVDIQGFEATKIPNGSVDLSITNVPFITGWNVADTSGDKDLSRKFRDIHDFCIAKNVRKLKPGGIGIFITSSGTLDNSDKLRAWLTNEGASDVVGAFRMNNQTFGGTGATSDIIVVRKRINGQKSPHAIDVSEVTGARVADYDTGDVKRENGKEVPVIKSYPMSYNKYFFEHPENMAGEMMFNFEKGETFQPTSRALFPVKGMDQAAMLKDWAARFSEMDFEASPEGNTAYAPTYDAVGNEVKTGSMIVDSQGRLCTNMNGVAIPVMGNTPTGYSKMTPEQRAKADAERVDKFNRSKIKGRTRQQCLKDYNELKKALAEVLQYQTEHADNEGLEPLLKKLNQTFDRFVSLYGNLHKNTQLAWLRNDVDYPSILALESFDERPNAQGERIRTFGKTDIFSQRVVEKEIAPKPENVKDGIIASIYMNGRIDLPYISEALGRSPEDVKKEIISSGLGFENPNTTELEVSYEYLSGNVREKLRQAQDNNVDGKYNPNIKALERVIPMNIPAHLIEFTLGSSWITPKLYEDFIKERTGVSERLKNTGGTWFVGTPDSGTNTELNRSQGVFSEMFKSTIFGHQLMEAAITNRSITVSRTYKHSDGTSETVTDKDATQACAAKIDEIRQDFKDWARQRMQQDPEMSAEMERVYNEKFNNYVAREIPEEFIPEHFGGAAHVVNGKPFKLRLHQAKAVIRGTMQSQLLAHEVGTGKTYTLISTAMEMRRLGTARKPMIVVQNATVGQFVESAKALYPNARILTIEEADRTAEGRKNFYAKIKYNDWDMIVVPQSVFERIPDSEERQIKFIQDKIEEKLKVLEDMKEEDPDGSSMVVRQAEAEIEKSREELNKITQALEEKRGKKKEKDEKREAQTRHNAEVRAMEMLDRETDDVENFDEMGIDAILVDEAHEYKHLGFSTAMQRGVKGIDPSNSKKAQGVYLKTLAVKERNNGRNVIFATGTPISNTAAEIWTFMRFLLDPDMMKEYGIYYFDDFVRNFGNLQQMLEFTTSGKIKENNRFAGYVNLPELVRIWSGAADTVLTREAGGVNDKIPKMEGDKAQDIYLPQTRALRSVMLFVKSELDRYENMTGKEKKKNSHIPLVMYGLAKAAAVDARLVVAGAEDDPNSKTNEAVRQTLKSLKETESYKGTVAIFADNYQNKKSGFNLYEDIRQKLIDKGVPADQIVVMRSDMTVKKKLDIFDRVNRGEVRVIMGSTFTLGTGVNIQERLHTLIHVDAPNRPMDYTQRNGRILRQGNLHKEMGLPVRVLRFGVEDSLDVTAYQRLKTKGAIADSIMNGKELISNAMENRSMEEDEDVFGDITAQLSGSEYAMLKNQAEKQVRKYTSKLKQWEAQQTHIHNQLPRLKGQIKAAEQRREEAQKHLEVIGTDRDGKITIGTTTYPNIDAMADLFTEHNKRVKTAQDEVREGSGERTMTMNVNVGGIDFTINTRVSRKIANNGQLSFESERNMTYSCEALGMEDVPVSGSRLKAAIEDIVGNVMNGDLFRERIETANNSIERMKNEVSQLESQKGKPFEHVKELEEAESRLEEYTEKMKAELAEKEAKYADIDATVEAAEDIAFVEDEGEEETEEVKKEKGRELSRLVSEGNSLDFLDAQGHRSAYRYAQFVPGGLTKYGTGYVREGVRPPMTAIDSETQDWRAPMEFNEWEQSVEGMRKDNGKADLVQGNGRTTGNVAYNPYFHIRVHPLNDQFSAAYDRPELVVVEGDYPESELTSGYRAEGAKNAVGLTDWHAGSVNGQLSPGKKVQTVLSRYFKPRRIVPWSEVAERIMDHIAGEAVTFPLNVVPPRLRAELSKRGAKFHGISGSVSKDQRAHLEEVERELAAGNHDFGVEGGLSDSDIAKYNQRIDRLSSTDPQTMEGAVTLLSDKLNTPIRVISRKEAEAEGYRRKKGWYDRETGEITVVADNHRNVGDIADTAVHEAVGHHGLRVLFETEEKLNNFLDEAYNISNDKIKAEIDRRTESMMDDEVERLREKMRKEHEARGENPDAEYYADMAKARIEAEKQREQIRRDATEEYAADLGMKIGEEGFERMDAEELTFWGKLKGMLQKALDRLLAGLKLPKMRRWTDKEWSYVLWRSWRNLREGKSSLRSVHNAGPLAEAEDIVMRERMLFNADPLIEKTPKRERIAKLRRSKPVEITGEEFEYSEDLKQHKKNALEYGKKLQGEYQNEDTGKTIQLQRGRRNGGLKEVLQHDLSDAAHIKSVAAIPDIIRKSIYIETEPNHDKEKNPDVEGYEHYVCGLKIGGEDYTVHSIVAEDRQGNRYYDHKLSRIEKGRLLDFMEAKQPVEGILTPTSGTEPTIRSERKVKELISILQVSDGEKRYLFRDGDMGLEEAITKMKADAAAANGADFKAKQDAMRAIGGNLSKLRQAMARQREYDITTVKSMTDLSKILLDGGLLDDLSKYETKRILSAIKDAVGREDTSKQVQRLMDIMVDNQLRMGANYFGKLLSVKGSRVDARGIEVQGELDPDGQKIAQTVRRATTRTLDDIENMMAEAINRMGSADQALADEAALEYAGLQIAHQYVEEIRESKNEEKELRKSIDEYKAERKAEAEDSEKSIEQARVHKDAGRMTEHDFNLLVHDIEEEERARWTAFKQYAEATNDAIRQNKIERAEAYRSLSERLGGVLGESVERAKAWREAEKRRVEDIHHNANSDMEGRPARLYKDEGIKDDFLNLAASTLFSPLRTFEQMLKMFGSKSPRGEGYLYHRYMRQLMDALDNEWKGYSEAVKQLDDKVSQVFGKKMKWTDLYDIEKKLPKGKVKIWDDGNFVDIELKQGNLVYIYMVDKMTDGRMKLRRMGITESGVERIKDFVDPKFIELADWIQEEFLVDKRNKYNEVYKRMFGTSMAAIENYFPLRVLKAALDNKPEEEKQGGQTTVSAETTGAWKKRTRNNKPLDIMNANVISLIIDHLKEMEHANAFSELSRDLNTLRKYKKFETRVKNMQSVYGSGGKLWNRFEECCSMATGDYKPPTSEFDRASMGVAKWVTAAKIAFRFFTAFKQLASFPAFLADCRIDDFAFSALNLKGSWDWAMKNLPNFEKRWKSRIAGDPILKRMENERGGLWKVAKERLGRWGMASNAFVDGLTVAMGARAMYRTKVRKYRRWGLPEEEIQKRAKQDAEILFNLSQQSSEGAFLSTIQSSGTFLSAMWTVFRNSSMSYGRQVYDACRNLGHRFKPGYKEQSIEFMRKQMVRDGVAENVAEREARREYRTGWTRDVARVAIYTYVLPAMWYMFAKMPYLLLGNDEEKKKDMIKDALVHGAFGTVEGLTGGDLISDGLNMLVNGEANLDGLEKNMPIVQDIRNVFRHFKTDEIAALNDLINVGVQVGLGVNPQTLEDMVVAGLDFAEKGDWSDTREFTFLIARIMNCPQSQLDEIYFDEIGMSGEEISYVPKDKLPELIAERYAEYKLHRNAPLTGWAYDEEGRKKAMDKHRKKAKTVMKERMTFTAATQRTRELLESFDEVSEKEKELNRLKKSDRKAYREGRKQLRESTDMIRHNRIKRYNHDIKRLTEKWLNAKTAQEADSIAKAMAGARERLLVDVDSIEAQ